MPNGLQDSHYHPLTCLVSVPYYPVIAPVSSIQLALALEYAHLQGEHQMHVVIIISLLLALGFLLWLALKPSRPTSDMPKAAKSAPDSAPWTSKDGIDAGVDVAFISNGNLFYKTDNGSVEQLYSPYVQEMSDRMEKSRERHAWKEGTSFGVSAGARMRQFDQGEARIMTTSAQFSGSKLIYFLKDEGMGGLFAYDFSSRIEHRLLHKQNLNLCDLHLDPRSDKLLGTSIVKGGMAHIVMMDREGNALRELTGGDTFDSAPVWASVENREILYQSTGLARSEQGHIVAHGNATIQQLNLGTGKILPVLEDAGFDFLQPKVCSKGSLYFIRRPYEAPKYATSSFLMDTLLFPFRLLRAVFHYLNFFSMMYTRKPLTSASGPAMNADIKEIILKGKRIDAEKALRSAGMVDGVPSLVPRSWQLMRRTRQGQDEVLATNVASYCITQSDDILYSNGRGVFLLSGGTAPRLVLKSDLIDDVVSGARGVLRMADAYGQGGEDVEV